MYASIIDAIGNTPMVKMPLNSMLPIWAKLEYLNPGGSVKDRSAKFMIEYAQQHGLINPGGTLIDASSGNQGIATAMIGALKGYKVIIAVSEKISAEKLATIQSYGAQIVMCPATSFIDDPQSYHSTALRIHEQTPNSFMPNQYFNPLNAEAHYNSLGPEIWKQTAGKITHFFAGAGTGGTVSGVGRYLKEKDAAIQIIAVDSAHSYHATNGNPKPYHVEGMGIDFDSPVMDYSVIDQIIEVSDNDALGMLKTLSHRGFLVGPSSGAVVWATLNYAQTHALDESSCAVIICGDSGRAYLSKQFYAQDAPVSTSASRDYHKKNIYLQKK